MARPTKYKSEYVEKAKKILALGATIEELADIFEVNKTTIYEWAYKNTKFSNALKDGRLLSDARVEESLYSRAMGYQLPEDKVFLHEGSPVVVPTTKHYPPDPTSMIFWLKNRNPDRWREKPEENESKEKEPVEVNINIHDNRP